MYYKILNKKMKHYEMQYKEGLNINCEETILDEECGNGLFFSDAEHILKFCDYGTKIAEVELPEGEPFYNYGDKYKAHRIILKNIRNLWTIETFEELIKNGTDIHINSDWAFRWTSGNGYLEIVKFLVENGADIHACEDYALRWASEEGHLEVVKFLVENGADIHAYNDFALRWASATGHLEVVKFLVKNGADIHACDDNALYWAKIFSYPSVINTEKLVCPGSHVNVIRLAL